MADFQLNHLNIPARDPEGLVRWYADKLGLRAEQTVRPGIEPAPGVERVSDLYQLRGLLERR